MPHRTQTVAVLGLGAMGLPMAGRLAQKFKVNGFDVDPSRAVLARDRGVAPAEGAQAAARGADTVLLAVRDSAQLESVLFGDEGIAPVLQHGSVVVLTSTVGIDVVRDVADRLAAEGILLADAPVSGGPARAGKGELLITVGASDEAFLAAEPVLQHLASTLERMGQKAGDGQAMKTVNQLLCGVHIAAGAEALALAGALGLDQEVVLRTLGKGAAASFMLGDRGPRMLQAYEEDGAEVLSRLDIFVKDLGIVGSVARSVGQATPVASAAEHLYLLGQAAGIGSRDDSAVITVLAPEVP